MNTSNCTAPIGFSELIEYWLDELDEAAEARIDEHLFGCQECGAKLDEIIALAGGVRAAFSQGGVRAFVTNAFVTGLAEQGVHLREYRVPCNGSVNCSVAPEDEVLVARLEAPLGGVTRLDAHSYIGDAQPEVFRDIPFDPASGEVVLTPKIAHLRAAPSHLSRVRLVAVDANGERVIGDYTFNHTRFVPSP
jgi:hypothetical protein